VDAIIEFLKSLHSPEGMGQLIKTGGVLILALIVFAETGLLVGFFLPGDSLLITAGIFTSTDGANGPGILNLWVLLGVLSVCAVVGDQVGYLLGRKAGPLIFRREDSMFFKKKHLLAATEFYERNGGKAIIVARFVPILRTFVPFAAGVAQMRPRDFSRYNVFGGILWVFSMILTGHFLGRTAWANKLHQIILVVIFVSVLPLIFSTLKAFSKKISK